MKPKSFTYRNFLDAVEDIPAAKHLPDIRSAIDNFKLTEVTVSHFSHATFLLDYSNKKYLYVEETCLNILGYSAKWFLDTGLEEYLSRWHPCDFNVINTKVFPDNISFLKTLSSREYINYIFSYNYRFRNPKDEYCTILQRFFYFPNYSSSEPAGIIGITFDISHYKTDSSIVHTIEKVTSTENGVINELVFKKIHPVYEEDKQQHLSKREIQVLKCVAEGLSSKQIAYKLTLSINTINNHRRNMLNKMHCKSSGEVINYAMKHGLV